MIGKLLTIILSLQRWQSCNIANAMLVKLHHVIDDVTIPIQEWWWL